MSHKGMTRMGLEVASAYRYIDAQEDFGPITREVLKGIVRKVAEAAISDVEDFTSSQTPEWADPGISEPQPNGTVVWRPTPR